MNTQFGIVEIGSTNTKAYIWNSKSVSNLGFKTIEFKKNYKEQGKILHSDIEKLICFINSVFDLGENVYVYATSIFREMASYDIHSLVKILKEQTNVLEFNVVSAEQENRYTVTGAISNIQMEDNVCVFVGGGGSTEISICKNGVIIEMANTNIGVNDIIKEFPDLSNDYASTSIEDVTSYILQYLNVPTQKAEYMILAGGDFLLRYKNAQYPVMKNKFFESRIHPLAISYDKNKNFENKYYREISLNRLKATTPDNPKWWDGTRAMCAFTNAVALSIGAKVIIPTRISMIYGIGAELNGRQ